MAQVKATLSMIRNKQADIRTYVEQRFPAIRNAVIAMAGAGFSHRQIAKMLKISKRSVWMHLTSNHDLRDSSRLVLTYDELYVFEDYVGQAYWRNRL